MRIEASLTGTSLAIAAALATVAAPPAPVVAQTVAAAPAVVQMNTGRGRLISLPAPMTDVFIADDKIADVQVRSNNQLYVFGKAPGETTVHATSRSGAIVYSATVRVGNNIDSIGQLLNVAMPDAQITATPMNGMVLLTGTVRNPEDAAEAQTLVQSFVGETTRVLSRLKTATPLQVNLQVRIAEVTRTFAKNIGVNITTADSSGGFKFGVGQGRTFSPQYTPGGPLGVGMTEGSTGSTVVTGVSPGTTLGLAGRLFGLDVLSAIDLGERIGQVTTLANPNLTALSGETGSFLAGGEIPIPVSQGLGAVSVEYKSYGVSLAYTPTVLADGRISLRVRPEVSQIDQSSGTTIEGITVPALTTRRAETTVELGSGQSLMIGGLLLNSHNNSIDKAPGLGDLPILGTLFRSNSFQRNETELMIVITPYLVKPVNAEQIALPTDGYESPSDVERVLLGKLSAGQTGGKRPVPTMSAPAGAAPAVGALSAPLPSGPALPTPGQPVTQAAAVPQPSNRRGEAPPAPGFSQN